MLQVPHLKKVLIGSAFAGAFFFASPLANAQEAPAAPPAPVNAVQPVGPAAFIDQARSQLAQAGIDTTAVDPALDNAVSAANAVDAALNDAATAAQAAVDQVAGQAANQAAVGASQGYAESPATNPAPLGLQETLEKATQPEFKPQNTDPNYQWRNDMFSKVLAGKPQADFVLHRVPGSYFDAPRIPNESDAAMTRGKSLYGPGTPLYVNEEMMCTLTAAGYDAEGRKVGITAGHCGNPGDSVSSADSWQVGPTGTIVAKDEYLDYSVIELGANAEVSRSYNGVTVNEIAGPTKPGDVACKAGVATGTTCGATLSANHDIQIAQVCAMVGDSGAPLFRDGRLVGAVTGGIMPLGLGVSCASPLQGALHVPTTVSNTEAIVESMNRRGGVGAGFHLPDA